MGVGAGHKGRDFSHVPLSFRRVAQAKKRMGGEGCRAGDGGLAAPVRGRGSPCDPAVRGPAGAGGDKRCDGPRGPRFCTRCLDTGWRLGAAGSPEPLGGGRCRAPLPLPGPSGSDLTTGRPEKTEKVARERRGARCPTLLPLGGRGHCPPSQRSCPGGALGTVVLLPQKERGFWPEPRRSARPLIVSGEIK